jgi:predicted GNAT family acetyltransferase
MWYNFINTKNIFISTKPFAMDIQHEHNNNSGTFFIEKSGERIAEMTYEQHNGKMVIDHTQVDDQLRGQNIGFELVKQGVDYARRSGLRIIAACPFAKKVIEEHADFRDVLA